MASEDGAVGGAVSECPRGLRAGGRPIRPQLVRRVPSLVHPADMHQAGACRRPSPRSRTSTDRHVPYTLRVELARRDEHQRRDCHGWVVNPGQGCHWCGGTPCFGSPSGGVLVAADWVWDVATMEEVLRVA